MKWNLTKSESKTHDGGVETVTHEAVIHLAIDDPADLPTIADMKALLDNLGTVDEIPDTAELGTPIDIAVRWTV